MVGLGAEFRSFHGIRGDALATSVAIVTTATRGPVTRMRAASGVPASWLGGGCLSAGPSTPLIARVAKSGMASLSAVTAAADVGAGADGATGFARSQVLPPKRSTSLPLLMPRLATTMTMWSMFEYSGNDDLAHSSSACSPARRRASTMCSRVNSTWQRYRPCPDPPQTYVRRRAGDWRRGFEYAWQTPAPQADEGPGLTWRQLTPRHSSGTSDSKIRGTCHPRRLGRLPASRGPARPLTHHHRRRFATVERRSWRPTKCGRRDNPPIRSRRSKASPSSRSTRSQRPSPQRNPHTC
jgi:hypothetical protein